VVFNINQPGAIRRVLEGDPDWGPSSDEHIAELTSMAGS